MSHIHFSHSDSLNLRKQTNNITLYDNKIVYNLQAYQDSLPTTDLITEHSDTNFKGDKTRK